MIFIIEFLMSFVESVDDKLMDVFDYLKSCRQHALSKKLSSIESSIQTLNMVEAELGVKKTFLVLERQDVLNELKKD